MARRKSKPSQAAQLLADLRTVDKLIGHGHSNEAMNSLLARRRVLTRKLAATQAPTVGASLAKLILLCARLAEDLAPYDVGARLNLRLARSIQRDLKQLLQPQKQRSRLT